MGFSEEFAKQIERAVTKSWQDIYERTRQYFQKWCKDNDIILLKTKISQVADFLQHLHRDKPSTIKGYRSVLGKVLIFKTNLSYYHLF